MDKLDKYIEKYNLTFIPVSIIISGVFIASAIYFGAGTSTRIANVSGGTQVADNGANPAGSPTNPGGDGVTVKPVTADDHILGNVNAAVKIIEFSDFECPFCQRVHPTIQQAVDEYDGQVAWVYRHLPLESIHSKARSAAEASECVADLGGNGAFWSFADSIFDGAPASLDNLSALAVQVGVSASAFNNCLNGGAFAQAVDDDIADANAAGGSGTPYSVVVAPNGKTFTISGAQPYASFKSIIDIALTEK